ncbi:hypothetical protein PV328_000928 [Microctonus aethiopoides]|uniref:Uncharacterized protein n=1 Tax=Microctonus aethiopoides TaxID=144406 RepID=A0AA39FX46_9HYME|nr:hypothetical protein PV328_000928 [Microctonus aethiopoides]
MVKNLMEILIGLVDIKRGDGCDILSTDRREGVIAMTTTGAQYALAASTGAGHGGGNSTIVEVEAKPSVVVVTTSSTSSSGSVVQNQTARGQQLITVVTSSDPTSANNLQPIQLSLQNFIDGEKLIGIKSIIADRMQTFIIIV